MGHRALVAYERPDETYNLHYSHWGANNLRLKHDITSETPFGGDQADHGTQRTLSRILRTTDEVTVSECVTDADLPTGQVDHDPLAIGCTFEELITEHLDYLHHEACYIVDRDFAVTAYRTHWFGLQYDCEAVTESPTVGHGAIRTVRWYEGEPVGDGYAQGEFRALKTVVGEMIDCGVLMPDGARRYMEQTLAEWVADSQDLVVRTATV